jgi:hypothetical protein
MALEHSHPPQIDAARDSFLVYEDYMLTKGGWQAKRVGRFLPPAACGANKAPRGNAASGINLINIFESDTEPLEQRNREQCLQHNLRSTESNPSALFLLYT